MAASQQSCVEVVDMLLQHGARVDLKDEVCFRRILVLFTLFPHVHYRMMTQH